MNSLYPEMNSRTTLIGQNTCSTDHEQSSRSTVTAQTGQSCMYLVAIF